MRLRRFVVARPGEPRRAGGSRPARAARSFSAVLRRRRAASVWLVAVVVLAGCRATDSPDTTEPLPPTGNTPGRLAPALEGRSATGEPYVLSGREADATLLVFYRGVSCGLCRERLRALQEHHSVYRGLDTRVVGVSLDESAGLAQAAEQLAIDFPLVSTDSATFARWGAVDAQRGTPLPASFLLDSRGVIRYRHVGRNAADRVNDAELVTVLQQLRAE